MKKRILSMILVLTLIMGIITGCGTNAGGSNASMEKITVSEMLANVVEENAGEAVIFTHSYTSDDAYKKNFSEKTKWNVWAYDGQAIYDLGKVTTSTLSSVDTSKKASINEDGSSVANNYHFKIDITRPDTAVESIWSPVGGNSDPLICFGKCEHVEINDESYMFFTSYKYDYVTGVEATEFTLIKDTEFTKDKIVVTDNTENSELTKWEKSVETREWNLDSSFYDHAWFAELTDEDKEFSGIEN